jgi:hypothetical protein
MAMIAALEQQACSHAHPHRELRIERSVIGFTANSVGTEVFSHASPAGTQAACLVSPLARSPDPV